MWIFPARAWWTGCFLEFREVSRLRFRYNFPEEPIEKPAENADSVEKLFFECVPNDKKRASVYGASNAIVRAFDLRIRQR